MSVSHILNLITKEENKEENRDNRIAISTIYCGVNSPNTTLGKVGDIYLDKLNNDCYIKSNKTWNHNSNLSEYIGPQGDIGPIGLQGFEGNTGEKGLQGEKGPTGEQGLQGERGITGIAGATGADGIQGLIGLSGPIGACGPQGLMGKAGCTGADGLQGLRGESGNTGGYGKQGLMGKAGCTGAEGSQGEKGLMGDKGEMGDRGLAGTTGTEGMQGPDGEIGNTGLQGEKGTTGPPGKQGERGERGEEGLMGPMGLEGDKGDRGEEGEQGLIGERGPTGERGERGEQGLKGDLYSIDNTFYVDGKYGNDIDAMPEDASRPYQTIKAAINAAQIFYSVSNQRAGYIDQEISIVVRSDIYIEEKLFENIISMANINIRLHDGTILVNNNIEPLFDIKKTSKITNVTITGNGIIAGCEIFGGMPSTLIQIDRNIVFNIQALALISENKSLIKINESCTFNLNIHNNKSIMIGRTLLHSLHGISMYEPLIKIKGDNDVSIRTNNIYSQTKSIDIPSIQILDGNPSVNLEFNQLKVNDAEGIEINSGTCNIHCNNILTKSFAIKVMEEKVKCNITFNSINGGKHNSDDNISTILVNRGTLNLRGGEIIYADNENGDKLHGILVNNGSINGIINCLNGGSGYSIYSTEISNVNLTILGNMKDIHWENGSLNLSCNALIPSSQIGSGIEIMDGNNNVNINCNELNGDIIDNGENVTIKANNYKSKNALLSLCGKKGIHKYLINDIKIKEISILDNHVGDIEMVSNSIILKDNFDISSICEDNKYNISMKIFDAKRFYLAPSFNGILLLEVKNYANLNNNLKVHNATDANGLIIKSNNDVDLRFGKLDVYDLHINPTKHVINFNVESLCNIYRKFYLGGTQSRNALLKFNANTIIYKGSYTDEYNESTGPFIGFGTNTRTATGTHWSGIMEININNFVTQMVKHHAGNHVVYISSSVTKSTDDKNYAKLVLKGDIWNTILRLQAGMNSQMILNIKELKGKTIQLPTRGLNSDDGVLSDGCLIQFNEGPAYAKNNSSAKIMLKDMMIINDSEEDKDTLLYFNHTTSYVSLINCVLINRNKENGYNAKGSLISPIGVVGKFMTHNCISNLDADETIIASDSTIKWITESELNDL